MLFRKQWLDLAGASTVEFYAGASTKAQKQPLGAAVVLFGYATDRTHIEGTFDALNYEQFKATNPNCWTPVEIEEMDSYYKNIKRREEWSYSNSLVYIFSSNWWIAIIFWEMTSIFIQVGRRWPFPA